MEEPNPLGFTEVWLNLGVVSDADVAALENEWETSDDKNPEHFRWAAFRRFLAAHRPLPPETARALYELGNQDADSGMGGAMMADIVLLKECPPDIWDDAERSPRHHLPKIVAKARAVSGCGRWTASRAAFEAALAQIPDREPEPYDAL